MHSWLLLFNIPFDAGHALFLAGTAQFVGRPLRRHSLSLLIAIAVLLTIAFTLVVPDSVARIFTQSFYQAGMNGLTAWYLWRYRERQSYRAYRIAALVLLAEVAASLAQGCFVITAAAPSPTLRPSCRLPISSPGWA
jgi:hypothetical protein